MLQMLSNKPNPTKPGGMAPWDQVFKKLFNHLAWIPGDIYLYIPPGRIWQKVILMWGLCINWNPCRYKIYLVSKVLSHKLSPAKRVIAWGGNTPNPRTRCSPGLKVWYKWVIACRWFSRPKSQVQCESLLVIGWHKGNRNCTSFYTCPRAKLFQLRRVTDL